MLYEYKALAHKASSPVNIDPQVLQDSLSPKIPWFMIRANFTFTLKVGYYRGSRVISPQSLVSLDQLDIN